MEYDTSKAVERALTLLETLSYADPPVGTRELARMLSYPSTATHRLLVTLEMHGFVQRDPVSEKYSLGTKILQLSSRLLESLDFRRVAVPIMREVRDRCNETVMLWVAEGLERVCVECVPSNHYLKYVVPIGTRRPIHTGSVGKVLLAHYPDAQMEAVLSGKLEKLTAATVTDPAELRRQVSAIRAEGWALSVGEGSSGNAVVAAPIWGGIPARVLAALSISVPSARFTSDNSAALIESGRTAAARISALLGVVPVPTAKAAEDSSASTQDSLA